MVTSKEKKKRIEEERKNSDKIKFDEEIRNLPPKIKENLLKKRNLIEKFINIVEEKVKNKSMGFYLSQENNIVNNSQKQDFSKFTINFLLDDFEKPIPGFDVRLLFGKDFEKLFVVKAKNDKGEVFEEFYLKEDQDIRFSGSSISLLRENCFDSIYDDLKILGSSIIFKDPRGFISALKSIDIHRNLLLGKFEKYIVVYAGAGSWLRGEKSNDFDVFIVVDDTDVKRMPRAQVKDQLTRIVWQMATDVSRITGINIHCQVYLLTDFWDALKDAHPVIFTFLRDGVPFYDRGLYNSWKELLRLGKIRPSPEAIDMHMNVANQLITRAKRTIIDIMMNDIYYAVLNPAQAILMLKGFNPTTPKETIKIFREVLLNKEKIVSKEDVETLDETIKLFKKIEHDKDFKLKGKEIDKFLERAENFLKNSKKIFEDIASEKRKESFSSAYFEFINQLRTLPGYLEISEDDLLKNFEKEYIDSKKLKSFTKKSLKNILKAKKDYDNEKITEIEVNKTLKEIRNLLSEVKDFRDRILMDKISRNKLSFKYDSNKVFDLVNFNDKIYLIKNDDSKIFHFNGKSFVEDKKIKLDFENNEDFNYVELNEKLISEIYKLLKIKSFYFNNNI